MNHLKDILDLFNGAGGDGGLQTDETVYERVVIVNGINEGFVGGNQSQERTFPDGRIEITREKQLVRTCIGCLVTTDPRDKRYPYYAGECSWGHPTCSDHLNICDEPGCGKLVCPKDGMEYMKGRGRFKCKKHYRIWKIKQVLKFIFLPFIRFKE